GVGTPQLGATALLRLETGGHDLRALVVGLLFAPVLWPRVRLGIPVAHPVEQGGEDVVVIRPLGVVMGDAPDGRSGGKVLGQGGGPAERELTSPQPTKVEPVDALEVSLQRVWALA